MSVEERIIIDYLNELSYLKKGSIKKVQVAKDTDLTMYQCSSVIDDLVFEGHLIRRFEVIDKETALNYGSFKEIKDIPKKYISDDGIELIIGENALIKDFYRFPNAHHLLEK